MNDIVQSQISSEGVEITEECYIATNSSLWRQQQITVSGVFITYNQELFVRSAIESVLAQTYPLDIIIADDASTDRTLAVIESVLQSYAGPHRVRVLPARRNRGICGNQNAALRFADGELIVLFEGDDISMADRVFHLVNAYQERGRAVGALGSAVRKMNRDGVLLGELTWPVTRGDAALVVEGKWNVVGCGLAIRRDCYFDFGPITHRLISGDIALWMRAAFLQKGGMAYVPRPLVNYRIHGGNTSSKISLNYASRAALRGSCQNLLKNEVAQVIELKKIARYRRERSLSDAETDLIWSTAFSIAHSRAALVLTIATKPCSRWLLPTALALRHRRLRSLALRALALAICPIAYRIRFGWRTTNN